MILPDQLSIEECSGFKVFNPTSHRPWGRTLKGHGRNGGYLLNRDLKDIGKILLGGKNITQVSEELKVDWRRVKSVANIMRAKQDVVCECGRSVGHKGACKPKLKVLSVESCNMCGSIYNKRYKTQRYCSRKCQKRSWTLRKDAGRE